VASGVDVVSTLDSGDADGSVSSAVSSLHSFEGSGLGTVLALNEEEALKIILGTPVDNSPLGNPAFLSENTEAAQGAPKSSIPGLTADVYTTENNHSEGTDIPQRNEDTIGDIGDDDGPSSVGNSLVGRAGWSSSFEEVPDGGIEGLPRPEDADLIPSVSRKSTTRIKNKTSLLRSPNEVQSYHSLLESYNLVSGSYVKTPDLRDFLQRFEGSETAADTTRGAEAEDPVSAIRCAYINWFYAMFVTFFSICVFRSPDISTRIVYFI
jgi:hypothetical protein